VLDADGEKAIGLFVVRQAVEVAVAKPDRLRSCHFVGHSRHGNAAFGMADRLLRQGNDLRVYIVAHAVVAAELDHRHPLKHTDMSGRDPDAGGGAHGVQQIGGKRPQVFVEVDHGLADGFQAGMRIAQNGANGHEIGS
jgi:hypothetical protein